MPLAAGTNNGFALEVAVMLVDLDGGEVVPLNVTQPGRPTLDIGSFLGHAAARWDFGGAPMKPRYAVSRDVTGAILSESCSRDLVIIGASRQRPLHQRIWRSIPGKVAWRCPKPLVKVRATPGVGSLINRWI